MEQNREDIDINSLMRPPKVCLCNNVSEKDITTAINEHGASTFEELQELTACSTGCGSCEETVRMLLEKEKKGKVSRRIV